MRHRLLAILRSGLAALTFFSCVSHAALLVDNGPPSSTATASDISSFAQADDFTLSASGSFNAVRFWAIDNGGDLSKFDQFSGTLSWFVYTNNVNQPGSVLASGTVSGAAITITPTGVVLLGSFAVVQLDFGVPNTLVPAGTFWFRVKEGGPSDPGDGSDIFWVWRNGQTGFPHRNAEDEVNPTWLIGETTDLAFQLTAVAAAVPEPPTLAVVCLGLLLLAAAGLRRVKTNP